MSQVWETTVVVELGESGQSRSIACADLSPAVLDHIFMYGIRQILNDGMAAPKGTSMADKLAKADKRLDALVAGNLRAASFRTGDPVKAEAMRIAKGKVEAKIKSLGKKVADYDVKALATALIDKDPAIMVAAKANVDNAAGLEVEVDLDL